MGVLKPKHANNPLVEFHIEDDLSIDEELMFEVLGCPTIRRLQQVALRHRRRVFILEGDLQQERVVVSRLELNNRSWRTKCELASNNVQLTLEQDNAMTPVQRCKIGCCLLV